MANNYTVQASTLLQAQDTTPNTSLLTITPNSGYVIQASDFSIGDSLPAEVTSVSFADTTTALTKTNKVNVTVNLASWFVMPEADKTLEIDIDGNAHVFKPKVYLNVVTKYSVSNLTTTVSFTHSTAAHSIQDNYRHTNVVDASYNYGTGDENTLINFGTVTFAPDVGYSITKTPSFKVISRNPEKWRVYPKTEWSVGGDVVFEIFYELGDEDVLRSAGERIVFSDPEVHEKYASLDPRLISAYYKDYKDGSILSVDVDEITLIVKGVARSTSTIAEYKIKVEDGLGRTYDFNTNTFTRSLTFSDTKYIQYYPALQEDDRLANENHHTISLPSNFRKESMYGLDSIIKTTVITQGNTVFWFGAQQGLDTDSMPTSYEKVITLNRLGQVDYTLTTEANSTTGVSTSFALTGGSTSVVSITNKKPLQTLTTFNPADKTSLVTSNNGYFSFSQNLGYIVTGTVSSHSHPSTSVVLTVTVSSLKIEVGDKVTGTGIPPDTKVASRSSSTVVLDKTSSATVSGTVTFERTVGITRQPTPADLIYSSPISYSLGSLYDYSFRVKEDTSDSSLLKINFQENSDQGDLVVGMMVEGDNIVGYPTIASFSSQGEITLSSKQTLSAGDLLRFSAAGDKVNINNISVTNPGTSTCKLNIDGYVERMGVRNVVAKIKLDNFTGTYAAPVAAALTADCTLSGIVIIEPLDSATAFTTNLTVNEVPSSGAGDTSISDDGKQIIYRAPATDADLSDTITYTVSDGINVSSAANIVITLTP